jgi:HSP20 family molecular chaperone IbpA
MKTALDLFFDSFDHTPVFQRKAAPGEVGTSTPRCNFFENPDGYIVTAEMPGVSKEALDVSFDSGVLTITGNVAKQEATPYSVEYRRTKFVRRLEVGDGIDVEATKAELVDGVLTLRLPKAERAKSRKISVL